MVGPVSVAVWFFPLAILATLICVAYGLARFLEAPKATWLRAGAYVLVVGLLLRAFNSVGAMPPLVEWLLAACVASALAYGLFRLNVLRSVTVGAGYVVARLALVIAATRFVGQAVS
jgi:hypothetical protein